MPGSGTYLISASQIEAVFGMPDAVRAVEEAFRLYGEGEVQMPPKLYLTFEKGDLRCMPVYIPSLGIAGVKNVNVHPANRRLPTVMALISLVDPDSGFPLAVMDGTYITALRTGAAGAVAARHLARQDAEVAGFVGAGRQAETQLEGLMIVRPSIRRVLVCDLDEGRADRFCRMCARRYGVEATPASARQAAGADIVVTTTPSRRPVVRDEWVRPGAHINAIGADAPGKQELDPAILRRARVVIDEWAQASHSGEVNVPLARGELRREDIACEIGELVAGRSAGRTSAREITVFDSTGLAVQDVCCAHAVLRKMESDAQLRGRLARVEFF